MIKGSRLNRWVRNLAWIVVVLSALSFIAFTVYLKPYKDRAATYDLTMVPRTTAIHLERLPQHVIDAVIATEDARFFSHDGIDLRGIARAALVNFRAKQKRQGASTITQQLAKQTYGEVAKTMDRKLVEAFVAKRIEAEFDKEAILSNYLSIIYLGNGFHGIENAAFGYFEKAVEDLTVNEAATLAGLIKAPSAIEPFDHPERAKASRNLVLTRMATEELLSKEEADRLREQPLVTIRDAVPAPM